MLYNDILKAIQNNFISDVEEAAIHLKEIDTIKERGYNTLAILYLKNKEFNNQIIYLIEHNDLQKKYIENSLKIIKPYDINNTKKQINAIYT